MTALYHITHGKNLAAIVAAGGLRSDRRMSTGGGEHVVIGFDHIKRRRLETIQVSCHPGSMVGDFVPFYFCPRSPMLYVIERRNADLRYAGGQRGIIHLVTSVEAAVAIGRPYAFTATNAGAEYTTFHSDVDRLGEVLDWEAINADDWRDPGVKERKQAEFLVRDELPWEAVTAVGTFDTATRARAEEILKTAAHRPPVTVQRSWYY
jgi:hypothetical protein